MRTHHSGLWVDCIKFTQGSLLFNFLKGFIFLIDEKFIHYKGNTMKFPFTFVPHFPSPQVGAMPVEIQVYKKKELIQSHLPEILIQYKQNLKKPFLNSYAFQLILCSQNWEPPSQMNSWDPFQLLNLMTETHRISNLKNNNHQC